MAETKPIARKYDLGIGVCFGHMIPIPMMGYIESGSETVSCEMRPVARTVKDKVKGFCGHTGIIISGSESITTMNEKTARKQDYFLGVFIGRIITGSVTRNELSGFKKSFCEKHKDDPQYKDICKEDIQPK